MPPDQAHAAPADVNAIDLRSAPDTPKANALPALVRWLRAVRDRRLAAQGDKGEKK